MPDKKYKNQLVNYISNDFSFWYFVRISTHYALG